MEGTYQITEAAQALEKAELTFDHIEGEFFAGAVTAAAVRRAWNEREQAGRALEAARVRNAHRG